MTEDKTIDEVYDDRNHAVLALAELVARVEGSPVATGPYAACWKPDGGDDADADEWAIVYLSLPTGQVSYHVPRDMVEDANIYRDDSAVWDGHDRASKNTRLSRFYTA
ncbi:putative protein 4 [Haloarcula hispanica icosahedral virus 2]|uniref:WDGH domain-containing protein n=1 Tax=Haloarcula hispanica icosahedral virus 2 TaxID=1154689 RepID=H9AZW0_9VIRU|nr:putative protein 4 [Haloarcula hispanica icosahedral virus 2]AFD02285.1 putative protein 4 [Haloarcula hispanica icosahedral virus 2]